MKYRIIKMNDIMNDTDISRALVNIAAGFEAIIWSSVEKCT